MGPGLFTPATAAVAGTWFPITARGKATAGSVTAQLSVNVQNMTAGEPVWIDLVYCARPQAQILIAWPDQPGAAAPRFTDATYLVRSDTPISVTRGRQDNISD